MCGIVLMVLKFTYLVNVKTMKTIAQNFLAFSEKLNFNSWNVHVKLYSYRNLSYQYRSHLQHNTPHANLFAKLKNTTNDLRPKTIKYHFREIWKQTTTKNKETNLLVK